jgi:hypothetical protein
MDAASRRVKSRTGNIRAALEKGKSTRRKGSAGWQATRRESEIKNGCGKDDVDDR